MAGILKVDQIQNSAGGSIALPGYVIQVQSVNFDEELLIRYQSDLGYLHQM